MFFFPNYATFFLLCSLKKLQISPNNAFFDEAVVLHCTRKKCNKDHNEIQINIISFRSGTTDAILKPCLMRGTGTDMAYNVASGSGAPQTQSELQLLLIELKH